MKNRLATEGIDLKGCNLTSALGESAFSGSRKFVKVTCESLAGCNSLDQALKFCQNLSWFLSVNPPRNPITRLQNRNIPHTHCPLNVPASNQPFLSRRPPPRLDQIYASINRSPFLQTPFNTQPIRKPKIPALMGLHLPPLPAARTAY